MNNFDDIIVRFQQRSEQQIKQFEATMAQLREKSIRLAQKQRTPTPQTGQKMVADSVTSRPSHLRLPTPPVALAISQLDDVNPSREVKNGLKQRFGRRRGPIRTVLE